MHLSEQPKEVSDVEGWLGARPVAWMLANMPVGPDWCAIHATHMTDAEARGLAAAGAVAGLCPVTEANLGDGIFDGPRWIAAGGVFGVGTDSNIRISMADELCALEYSQRLRDIRRNVMIPGEGSVGAFLFRAAARGAAQALGRPSGEIAPGLFADLLSLDMDHAALCALPAERILDGMIFAAKGGVVRDVWSAGRHVVREGRHVARDRIAARYRAAIRQLMAAA
jgi:formiminoglutamate deiminase